MASPPASREPGRRPFIGHGPTLREMNHMNAVTPRLNISYDTGEVAYDPVEQEFTLSEEVLAAGFDVALEVVGADHSTSVYLLSARLLGTRPAVIGTIADIALTLGCPAEIATAAAFSGADLSFALVAAPTGVSIDAATGRVSITADALLTAAPITVKASNAAGAASLTFALTVNVAGPKVVATDFTDPAALAELGFLHTLAPSWTHVADGFARLVPTGASRAHGDWSKAAGDGTYRVLARWSGADLTPSVDRRFSFGARIARKVNDWTGIRVETFATGVGDRRLHIREYTGSTGATRSLSTVEVGWAYDTWYWLEIEIAGTSVRGRLYPEAGTAPDWQVVATTSVIGAGAFGPGGFPAVSQSPTIDIKRLEYRPLAT